MLLLEWFWRARNSGEHCVALIDLKILSITRMDVRECLQAKDIFAQNDFLFVLVRIILTEYSHVYSDLIGAELGTVA